MRKNLVYATGLLCGLALAGQAAAAGAVDSLLAEYTTAGAQTFNADAGRRLWSSSFGDRSCGSCHGDDLSRPGRHQKTGKPIDAMAPSVNPERLQDPKKIAKWLYRNCKWTLGRECTPQEKGDLLTWLRTR